MPSRNSLAGLVRRGAAPFLRGLAIPDDHVRLNLSFLIAAMAMGNIFFIITTGAAVTGYMRDLQAGDFIYGLVIAMPYLGSGAQLHASHRLQSGYAVQRMAAVFGVLQKLLWIAAGLVPYILPAHLQNPRILAVVALVGLACIAGAYLNIAQTMVFSTTIPDNIRGSFLTLRSRVGVIVASLAGLAVSWLLDVIPGIESYTFVFLLAGATGLVEVACLAATKGSPAPENHGAAPFRPLHTIRQTMANQRFRRYCVFWICWNFVYTLTSPFVAMYCLRNLQLSFVSYNIWCILVPNLVSIAVLPFWGRFMDKRGSKPAMYLSFSFTSLLGFLFLLSRPGDIWIPAIFHTIGGAFWVMVEVANNYMMLEQTPKENRSAYIAVFCTLSAVLGHGLAAVTSGTVLSLLGRLLEGGRGIWGAIPLDNYQLLIVANAVLRLLVIFLLLPRVEAQKPQQAAAGTAGPPSRAGGNTRWRQVGRKKKVKSQK